MLAKNELNERMDEVCDNNSSVKFVYLIQTLSPFLSAIYPSRQDKKLSHLIGFETHSS